MSKYCTSTLFAETKDATICFWGWNMFEKKEQNNTKYDKIIIINSPDRNLFTLQQFSCKSSHQEISSRSKIFFPEQIFRNWLESVFFIVDGASTEKNENWQRQWLDKTSTQSEAQERNLCDLPFSMLKALTAHQYQATIFPPNEMIWLDYSGE